MRGVLGFQRSFVLAAVGATVFALAISGLVTGRALELASGATPAQEVVELRSVGAVSPSARLAGPVAGSSPMAVPDAIRAVFGPAPSPRSYEGEPRPQDAPFDANRPISTNPLGQHRPAMAVDSLGRTYVAYEHQATPTNVDVSLSWSDDGGTTWVPPSPLATGAANERNPNVVISAGDVVTVFVEQDLNLNAFAYFQSNNRAQSWSSVTIGTGGAPIRDFRFPSFVADGDAVYGMYQVWCTLLPDCSPGSWSVIILDNPDITSPSTWAGVFFAVPPDLEFFHPATGFNRNTGDVIGALEYEVFDETAWDLAWFRYNPGTGFFQFDGSMCADLCPSTEFVWPAVAVDGNQALVGAQFLNATAFGVPFTLLVAVNSTDGGQSYALVNQGTGLLDFDAVDQKFAAFHARGAALSAAYRKGTSVGYTASSDGGTTFEAAALVTDNAPGTAVDLPHAVAIANTSAYGAIVVWHDGRDGDDNIYVAGFQRFAITVDTNPAGLLVRFDGGPWLTAPASSRLPVRSTHAIEGQPIQPGTSPGSRFLFGAWSDGQSANPRNVVVSANAVFRADFTLQHNVTLESDPPGRIVAIDGTQVATPFGFWCDDGSPHNLNAPAPQAVGPQSRYRFDAWSDGGAQAHAITCTGATTITATFVLQHFVTVSTAPEPLQVTVDGTIYNAPQSFWFDEGSPHTLLANSTILVGQGARYRFVQWTGGPGTAAWTVVVAAPTDYVASYEAQYHLTLVNDDPAGLGTSAVSQPSPDGWYDADTDVQLTAADAVETADGQEKFVFVEWTELASSQRTQMVSMTGPMSLTLEWKRQVRVRIEISPLLADVQATVNGVTIPAEGVFLDEGVPVTIRVPTEIVAGGRTFRFVGWVGISSGATLTYTPQNPVTLTARYEEASALGSPVVLGGLIALVVAALLVAFFLWRRRRGPIAAPPATAGVAPAPPPPPPEMATMECPSCGMTIEAKPGRCPICGAEVTPPGDERVRRLEEAYRSGRISEAVYRANLEKLKKE